MKAAAPEIEASAPEIRTRIRSQIGTFSGLFDQSLDEIIKASPEPPFRRRLLVFKMDALPKLQQAMLHADPFVAFIDTWAFIVQVQEFLRKFADAPELQEARERAMKGFAKMEAKLEDIGRAIAPTGDIDLARQEVYKWARTHPLSEQVSSRATTEDLFAAYLSKTGADALKVVGSLPETADDAMARIDLYAEYLPKQMRWQAELIAGDLVTPEMEDALQALAYVPQSLERITKVVEEMPGFISRERTETLKILSAELDKTLQALRRERIETLAFGRDERVAVLEFFSAEMKKTLDHLRNERVETLAFARDERVGVSELFTKELQRVIETLSREREETLAEMEMMRTKLMQDLARESQVLIDHIFIRVAQLLAAVLVVSGIFCIVLLRYIRKQRG